MHGATLTSSWGTSKLQEATALTELQGDLEAAGSDALTSPQTKQQGASTPQLTSRNVWGTSKLQEATALTEDPR